MRRAPLVLTLIVVASLGVARGESLTVDQAVQVARERNPELLAARQDAQIARSRLQKARYWNQFNPTIEGGAGQRRFDTGGSGAQRQFDAGGTGVQPLGSVSLEVEVAGQRARRIDEAERNAARVDAEIANVERLLVARVRDAFYRALYLERRLDLARRVEELNRRLRDASAERFRSGEVPKLEANLAVIRHGQSRKETFTVESDYRNALREIERLMAREPVGDVVIAGDLAAPSVGARLDALLETARRRRQDLQARDAEIRRVDAEAALTRRLIVPNPTVKGLYDTESEVPGTRDRILGGAISVPLPVFDRRQAELTALAGQRTQAAHARDATALGVDAEVRDAFRSYEAALAGVEVFEADVVGRIAESFRLVETAYREGKIGLLQLIVVQNDLVATQVSYLESLADYWRARVALERAVGELPGGSAE